MFLIVLNIFVALEGSDFKTTKIFSVLEIIVIIAIIVAIGSELFATIWKITEMIIEKLKERSLKRKQDANDKLAKMSKAATCDIVDEPVQKNMTSNKLEMLDTKTIKIKEEDQLIDQIKADTLALDEFEDNVQVNVKRPQAQDNSLNKKNSIKELSDPHILNQDHIELQVLEERPVSDI